MMWKSALLTFLVKKVKCSQNKQVVGSIVYYVKEVKVKLFESGLNRTVRLAIESINNNK